MIKLLFYYRLDNGSFAIKTLQNTLAIIKVFGVFVGSPYRYKKSIVDIVITDNEPKDVLTSKLKILTDCENIDCVKCYLIVYTFKTK